MNKRHRWTDDDRDIVRRDYKGTRRSGREIATKLGVSFFAVQGQLAKMGLLQPKSPPWTGKELERLSELIHSRSITEVAKILHRSPNAVKVKATRLKLGLRTRDDWYTKRDVCEIFGVDHKWVQARIDSGALIATWHNGRKPQQKGANMWHIETKALRNFIINYSGELLGRNVDIQHIVWLVAGV